jgi:hypothetical protein
METPGEVLFAAVEGTRHPDGILHKPLVEIHGPLKNSGETGLALPLAIVLPDSGRIRPFKDKVVVRPGMPFSFAEQQQELEANPSLTPTELMMRKLADLLPEKYQGEYKKQS